MAGVGAMLVIALILVGADAPVPGPAPLNWTLAPSVIRMEIAAGTTATQSWAVTAGSSDLTILAAETDCSCLRITTTLPLRVAAGTTASLDLLAHGVQSGLKPVTLRTNQGSQMSAVHLVVSGSGTGRDQLQHLRDRARLTGAASVVFLLHDLHGKIRNCGCNGGSLGGADRLAALPGAWALTGGLPARWWLSGDTDGPRIGVAAALAETGWQPAPATAPVRITTDPRAPQRADLIPALGTGGLALWAVLMDAQGRPIERAVIPVDQSLPAQGGWLTRWKEPVIPAAPATGDPAASCAGCHPAATAIWHASAHAKPWAGLPEADRTAGCIPCHSQPSPAGPIPGVTCVSCHQGSEAHARAAGVNRTLGTVSCRSCHDGQHHPGFIYQPAWQAVAHD